MKNEINYYPIAVRLKNKKALVVGGGMVAERKVKTLIATGARVKVVSPDLTPQLKNLARQGGIRWVARTVRQTDLYRADIAIAATSDNRVNRKVSRWAKERNILVNVVDNPSLSDFISPALLGKRKAIIAVYTDGKDPILSRDLKNFLKENWNVFLSYRDRL